MQKPLTDEEFEQKLDEYHKTTDELNNLRAERDQALNRLNEARLRISELATAWHKMVACCGLPPSDDPILTISTYVQQLQADLAEAANMLSRFDPADTRDNGLQKRIRQTLGF